MYENVKGCRLMGERGLRMSSADIRYIEGMDGWMEMVKADIDILLVACCQFCFPRLWGNRGGRERS